MAAKSKYFKKSGFHMAFPTPAGKRKLPDALFQKRDEA
jgi:hypothetical protein